MIVVKRKLGNPSHPPRIPRIPRKLPAIITLVPQIRKFLKDKVNTSKVLMTPIQPSVFNIKHITPRLPVIYHCMFATNVFFCRVVVPASGDPSRGGKGFVPYTFVCGVVAQQQKVFEPDEGVVLYKGEREKFAGVESGAGEVEEAGKF